MYKVDNAVIMAAGRGTRFGALTEEKHKALLKVRGEILVERQLRQLKDAGVGDIFIVTGHKAEQFEYLKDLFRVKLIFNGDYAERNNNGSIYAAREVIGNSYICSCDNYFVNNPFSDKEKEAYYAAEYAEGYTDEWCMSEDEDGYISGVTIGGENAWYMMGHTFWNREFSVNFLRILDDEYDRPETKDKLWEKIFSEHLDVLRMKIRRYPAGEILEFDSLKELGDFDQTYAGGHFE